MSKHQNSPLIAVDGGGTSCRLVLLWDGARTDVQEGSANVATDFTSAIATLERGLAALAAAAGTTPDHLRTAPGYLGLAGVVDSRLARRVAQALAMPNIVVEDDRIAALTGALGETDGTVVGIGTGSFLARRAEGAVTLLGGWGFVLGDEASGADLGRQLLRRVLHVADGLAAPSDLTAAVLKDLGGTPADVVAFANEATPARFAAFAPRIVAAAQAGDSAGVDLMRSGAAYILRAAQALGWAPGEALCPIGGLAAHYADHLPQDAAASLVAKQGTALDGALRLAAQHQSRRAS